MDASTFVPIRTCGALVLNDLELNWGILQNLQAGGQVAVGAVIG